MKDSPTRDRATTGDRVCRLAAVAGAFYLCTGLVACSGGMPLAEPSPAQTSRVSVNGDWDDIHAAVAAGVSKAEMATLGYHDPDPDTRIYRLRTTTGQPGTLRVTRQSQDQSQGRNAAQASGQAEPDPGVLIGLNATVGRFGDPRAETRLLTAVSRRLGELQGVDAAPLSW